MHMESVYLLEAIYIGKWDSWRLFKLGENKPVGTWRNSD